MAGPGSTLDEAHAWLGCPLQIGEVIAGKYRIERQLGRGGMGIVLAATHLQLEHLVAIKVMRRDLLEDERAVHRLIVEARVSAKIRSEHVVRVLDVGTLDNGFPFIVMEYLEGEDLADLLDREGSLEVGQAVLFLLQCCEALAEVHVREMVHRDLKPGNVFLAKLPDGSPSVKIVDFGISKHIGGPARGNPSSTQQVLGSPYYMSPEQMRAEPADERSDIWALGAILFEMLTGKAPFGGETLPEVYASVLGKPTPSLEQVRPDLPSGLDDVVQRCLEKDPARRFCDVADLAEALAPFGNAAAQQSIERVTRILTNPEFFRTRGSSPGANGGTEGVPVPAAELSVGAPLDPQPVVSVGPLPDPVPPAESSSGVAEVVARSRSTSTELGPLSATGSIADQTRNRGSLGARSAWLAVIVAAALVAAAFWLRARSGSSSQPLAAPPSLPPAMRSEPPGLVPAASPRAPAATAPAPASTTTARTSELPAVVPAGGAQPRVAPAKPVELHTEKQALRPAPAPVLAPVGVAPGAGSNSDKDRQGTRRVPAGKEPAPAPVRLHGADDAAPAPEFAPNIEPSSRKDRDKEREKDGSRGDPWNPNSFGDRH